MSSLLSKKKLSQVTRKFLVIVILTVWSGSFVSCSVLDQEFSSDQPNFVQAQERSKISERQIPGTNPLELLKLEQIQQELGLSKGQIAQLKQANIKIASKLTNLPPNRPASLRNSQPRTQEENGREKVAQILTPEQLNRFKQITLQVYGWGILSKEEVTEILAITTEQNQELDLFRDQNQQMLSNSLQMTQSKDPEECQKVLVNNYQKLMETSQESYQKLISILDKEQVQTLEYMQGEKFNLNFAEIPAICP